MQDVQVISARLLIGQGLKFGAWSLFNLIFPTVCPVCETRLRDFSPLCQDCLDTLQVIENACEICGQPLYTGGVMINQCGSCEPLNPAADRTLSLFYYVDTLQRVLPLFKYERHTRIGKLLAEKMAQSLDRYRDDITDLDGVIPLPLHPAKLRKREFNQTLILAKAVSKRFDLPLLTDLVVKTKNPHSQVGLSKTERKRSVKGAFKVPKPERVEGRRFLVIDDVLTTGATSTECCKVLKKSGASYVWFYSLARR